MCGELISQEIVKLIEAYLNYPNKRPENLIAMAIPKAAVITGKKLVRATSIN